MGDRRRHLVFADFIAERWPDRNLRIADVAGGHGALQSKLWLRGYRNIVTFDKREKRWTERSHYRYQYFDVEDAREFDLLVGMHPDEASDVILCASLKFSIPCAIVPCCPRPTVWEYSGNRQGWIDHLQKKSGARRERLEMKGANSVLTIGPSPSLDAVLSEYDRRGSEMDQLRHIHHLSIEAGKRRLTEIQRLKEENERLKSELAVCQKIAARRVE